MGMDLYINEIQTKADCKVLLTPENYMQCSVDYCNVIGNFSPVALSNTQLVPLQDDLNIHRFHLSFFPIGTLKYMCNEWWTGRHERNERYYPLTQNMVEKRFNFYVERSQRKPNQSWYYDYFLVEYMHKHSGSKDRIVLAKVDKEDGSIDIVKEMQINETGWDLHRLLGASRQYVYEIAREVAYVRKPFRMSGGHNYEGNPHYKTVEYLLNKYSQENGGLYLTLSDMAAFKEIEPLMSEATRELDLWSLMTDKTIMEISW